MASFLPDSSSVSAITSFMVTLSASNVRNACRTHVGRNCSSEVRRAHVVHKSEISNLLPVPFSVKAGMKPLQPGANPLGAERTALCGE